jgi:hypothetical protein
MTLPHRAFFLLPLLVACPVLAADRLDCRYARLDGIDPRDAGTSESILLPDTDVFRPILADQREPRFYADYRRVHFRFTNADSLSEGHGQDINASMVAFGGEFGLWGRRQPRGCDGLQVSLFGVVFAQFNLDSKSFDLLNSDYLVGPMVTYRSGRFSGRARFFHQSSHLGDEFLLNYAIAHGVERRNLSFEVLDLIVSLEDTWWRIYGGGGLVAFSSKDPDLTSTPGIAEGGFELRSPRPWSWRNSSLTPLFGASFSTLQATGWSVNGSFEAGVEWSRAGANQRVRALVVAQRGAFPFSQFFFEKTENLGLQLQCEF